VEQVKKGRFAAVAKEKKGHDMVMMMMMMMMVM